MQCSEETLRLSERVQILYMYYPRYMCLRLPICRETSGCRALLHCQPGHLVFAHKNELRAGAGQPLGRIANGKLVASCLRLQLSEMSLSKRPPVCRGRVTGSARWSTSTQRRFKVHCEQAVCGLQRMHTRRGPSAQCLELWLPVLRRTAVPPTQARKAAVCACRHRAVLQLR